MLSVDVNVIKNNLEEQEVGITDVMLNLASQGYIINNKKLTKLNIAVMLSRMFDFIYLADETTYNNTMVCYKKLVHYE